MNKTMKIVSLSGGKDSTAMLLHMLELKYEIDQIIFFDSGWEFPQMYKHLDKLEKYINRPITRLYPKRPFDVMLSKYGWPNHFVRWCTTYKVNTIKKLKPTVDYQGIAADEFHRIKKHKRKASYPLIEWGWTEKMCLEYCYKKGFTWAGLYKYFKRVSCFCCPLKGIKDFRKLYNFFPDEWNELKAKDRKSPKDFKRHKKVIDLESEFCQLNKQLNIFSQNQFTT